MSILLQLPNINNDLSGIKGVTSIVQAYKQFVPKLHLPEVVGLATFFAVVIIAIRIVAVLRDAYASGEPMNIKKMFDLAEEYIKVAAMLIFAPFIIYYIELGFSYIQDAAISKFNVGESSSLDVLLDAHDKGFSLNTAGEAFKAMVSLFAGSAFIELLLGTLLKYAVYMVVAGRYLYLILLQIIQPFAVVAFLSDKTRHFTLKYLGHLGYVYLIVPMILIADKFSDVMTEQFLGTLGSVKIIFLLVACILKFSLFKVANNICKNVMSI